MDKYFNKQNIEKIHKVFATIVVFYVIVFLLSFDFSILKSAFTILIIYVITILIFSICIYIADELKAKRNRIINKKLTLIKYELESFSIAFINGIIHKHLKVLARKRQQLIIYDDYGKEIRTSWDNEKKYFVSDIIAQEVLEFTKLKGGELLRKENIEAGEINISIPEDLIDQMIDDEITNYNILNSEKENEITFSPDMDPIDYEKYCTELLNKSGWKARTTKASGDQGLDIYAENNEISVVLQCKRYSQPVGNKAVQEAHAAKGFMRADYAVVITNASYTRSAKELANTLNVKLLHHTDLIDLENHLKN